MQRTDIQELLAMVQVIYPNFKPVDKTATVNGWYFLLQNEKKERVLKALEIYCKTNTSGFAPTPAQLLQLAQKLFDKEQRMTEIEAWAAVRSAIRNGLYHSDEEFRELPETCKRAIGEHEMLREWAAKDSDVVETVIMSQFIKSYRIAKERMIMENYMPELKPEKAIDERTKPIKIEDDLGEYGEIEEQEVNKAIKKLLGKVV